MAVNKKGSRKIVVDDREFRWRATGNDGGISVIIWPTENDSSRVVGKIDYHNDWRKLNEGHSSSKSQLIVTNRIIREVILKIGSEKILNNRGQINIGAIEEIYDIKNAVRN